MKKFPLYVTIKTPSGKNTVVNIKNLPIVSSHINRQHLLTHLQQQAISISGGGKYEILDVVLDNEVFLMLQKEVFSKQQSFFRDTILVSDGNLILMRFVNEKLH